MLKLFALLLLSSTAFGAGLNLTCTAPTTHVDGTPLLAADIDNFTFYKNAVLIQKVGPTCSYSLPIAAGSCVQPADVFTVTATAQGLESAKSAPQSVVSAVCTPFPAPSAPTGLKITTF